MKIIKRRTTKTSNQGNQENRKKRKCREGELLHCSPSCNTRYSMYKSSTSPTYFPTFDSFVAFPYVAKRHPLTQYGDTFFLFTLQTVPLILLHSSITLIHWFLIFTFFFPHSKTLISPQPSRLARKILLPTHTPHLFSYTSKRFPSSNLQAIAFVRLTLAVISAISVHCSFRHSNQHHDRLPFHFPFVSCSPPAKPEFFCSRLRYIWSFNPYFLSTQYDLVP